MENFLNPSADFRGLPFWSWNCRISREYIEQQLEIFKEMGFGGVVIHPREGLDTEYLGEEFMELIKYTVECSKKMGMICWLYDDDRFPSGAADGFVTKNPRFRARQLRLTKTPLQGFCLSKKEFEEEVDSGKIPKGYYVTAYEIKLENKLLADFRRLETEDEVIKAQKRGGNVRFAYLELTEEEEWFQGQTYSDTMNPDAVEAFINVTHKQYQEKLGQEFGQTASAIFTDEPRIGKQPLLSRAESEEDIFVPYNEYFAESFRKKYAMDALDILPEYIWDNPAGDVKYRYIYRDMVCECFVQAFMDKICDWCRKNKILMTGHILGESPLTAQTATVGETMRCYRKMDIPGVDILIDGREFTSVKQAASIAAQNGGKDVMSELYGVTNWDCTFKTYKLQGDWQAALGITIRVPHLSHMSLEGEAKRDWPGSIFYQAPWYQKFHYIEDYFSRLHTVLTRGRRITRIAVVHPVESMWVKSSPDDLSKEERRELDKNFTNLSQWLLYAALDYDYLCESLLPEQWKNNFDEKLLRIGECSYETVIVPGLVTIRESTLEILEQFSAAGGTVIFAGRIPELVNGTPSDRAEDLAKKSICVSFNESNLVNSLAYFRDVEIKKEDGARSDNLLYQYREDGESRWLFIAHGEQKDRGKEVYTIKIEGNYDAELYDAVTGKISPFPTEEKKDSTIIQWECYGEDSLLLKLEKSSCHKSSLQKIEEKEPEIMRVIKKIDQYRLSEPNVLLLDYPGFSIDNGEIREKDETLKTENRIRKELGFFERTGMDRQPWATEEKETHIICLFYEFYSEFAFSAELGIERPEKRRILLNGVQIENQEQGWYIDKAIKTIQLPNIHQGWNMLQIEMGYNQKSFLENIYILGDFAVNSEMHITKRREKLGFGNITTQGMPFYSGNIDYIFETEILEEDVYFIRIPEFSAPLLEICVDGVQKELIAYEPHRAALGKLEKGIHQITVKLYGNRFNTLGMLHNGNPDYTWYGNLSYRTEGKDWTDEYQLRPLGIMSDIYLEK